MKSAVIVFPGSNRERDMAHALKLVSVNRGRDPREFTLVAFGGAGAASDGNSPTQRNSPFCSFAMDSYSSFAA